MKQQKCNASRESDLQLRSRGGKNENQSYLKKFFAWSASVSIVPCKRGHFKKMSVPANK